MTRPSSGARPEASARRRTIPAVVALLTAAGTTSVLATAATATTTNAAAAVAVTVGAGTSLGTVPDTGVGLNTAVYDQYMTDPAAASLMKAAGIQHQDG